MSASNQTNIYHVVFKKKPRSSTLEQISIIQIVLLFKVDTLLNNITCTRFLDDEIPASQDQYF
jgi:hypothetical protein